MFHDSLTPPSSTSAMVLQTFSQRHWCRQRILWGAVMLGMGREYYNDGSIDLCLLWIWEMCVQLSLFFFLLLVVGLCLGKVRLECLHFKFCHHMFWNLRLGTFLNCALKWVLEIGPNKVHALPSMLQAECSHYYFFWRFWHFAGGHNSPKY